MIKVLLLTYNLNLIQYSLIICEYFSSILASSLYKAGFCLGLGEHPSKVCDGNGGPKMKKRLSPSKIRRQDRQAAKRLLAQKF